MASKLNPAVVVQNPDHEKLLGRFRENLLLMGKVILPKMFQVRSPRVHKAIASLLLDETKKWVCVVASRGLAKSSLVACLYVLYHLFFEPGPKVILLVSRTLPHTQRLLQTIKDALDYSLPLRSVFGYWGEHSARAWTQSEVVLKDGTLIVCRGAGQMVVGLKHGHQRPTLVVLDDPEDAENTKTAEAMENNLRWLLQSLLPGVDPQRGRVVVIGTPQHQRSMVEVLSQMDGWHSLRIPAANPQMTEATWEEWLSLEKLKEIRESYESVGRGSSFWREYMCVVTGDEEQLFKPEYFRHYEGTYGPQGILTVTSRLGKTLSSPERIPVHVFMGIDPASSVAQTADYSVIMPVAVDADMNRYVLPYFRKRVTPMGLAEAILEYDTRYQPRKTRIESTGYQEMLREYLRSQRVIPGLEIKENPRTPKSKRLETLQPFFFKGQVFHQSNMRDLEDELLMYPRGKHDDLLDGLFYAMRRNYPPSRSEHGFDGMEDDDRYFALKTKESHWLQAH